MQPDPLYHSTVTFAGHSFELWRTRWKEKRTEFTRWFAKYEGQTESGFRDTYSDNAAQAIGTAILLLDENDAVAHKVWGSY